MSNDQKINEEVTKEMMDKHKSEKQNINKIINELSDKIKYLPLHLYDDKMIKNIIKQWILNDKIELLRTFSLAHSN